jgi:hypothetical protein
MSHSSGSCPCSGHGWSGKTWTRYVVCGSFVGSVRRSPVVVYGYQYRVLLDSFGSGVACFRHPSSVRWRSCWGVKSVA